MKLRLTLFGLGICGLVALYGTVIAHMPGPGKMHSPYSRAINKLCVPQRHVTDAVTAVNFDYRGFDTLGEEFILFASVMGTLVLLREAAENKGPLSGDSASEPRNVRPTEAVRVTALALVGPTVVFGVYVVTHGQLTPGGGFQGGVVLATAPLLVYLADDFKTFKRITSHALIEISEAVGGGMYAVIGAIALVLSRPYMTNVLPLAQSGGIASGGIIPLISIATGLEVAAGFVLLLYAFLQKTLAERESS